MSGQIIGTVSFGDGQQITILGERFTEEKRHEFWKGYDPHKWHERFGKYDAVGVFVKKCTTVLSWVLVALVLASGISWILGWPAAVTASLCTAMILEFAVSLVLDRITDVSRDSNGRAYDAAEHLHGYICYLTDYPETIKRSEDGGIGDAS